jgi:diguanylate cyclase (GGDEF)-like protein/PAS domain S-box-containing protein
MQGHNRPSNTKESDHFFDQRTVCLGEPDFHEFFEHGPEGILIADAETGAILDVNETFVRMSGYSRETVLGRKFWMIDALREIDGTAVMLRAAQGMDHFFYGDLQIKTKDEKTLDAELMCSVHLLGSCRVIQINVRDVTERKRIEQSRPRSDDQYRRLFESNPHPMMIYDGDSLAILAVNDAAISVYGYSREEFQNMTIRDIHLPEEIADFLNSVGSIHLAALKPDVWKHRKKNGELLDVELEAQEIRFNNKDARFIVATDVTAREQAEELLKETRRILQEMLSSLPIGILITDSKGNSIIGNPEIRRIWGDSRYVGRGRYEEYKGWWADSSKRIEANEWAVSRAILKGETSLDEIIDIEGFDGSRKTILNSAVPLRDSRGNIAGAIVVNQDITERRRQEAELRHVHELLKRQATTDALTGIFNRQKFSEELHREILEVQRYNHPLSLIMFDVDHFKMINDTYGHLVGDAVLKEITALVLEHIRSVDIFARWGGEEFVILSPNTAVTASQQLAEKLRQMIAQFRFSCPSTITASFGITQFLDDDVADSFINRSDMALYRAKERGRNRVESL